MDNDSDSELLNDLLANDDGEESEKEVVGPKKSLKELDFNFLDSEGTEDARVSEKKGESSLVHEKDADSSDEEDRRYFEEQNYSDYGRTIKNMLKDAPNKVQDKPAPREATGSKSFDFNNAIKSNGSTASGSLASKDVYSDPFFGLRIINPLVSSAELTGRMAGKTAVTVSKVRHHVSSEKIENDWVIAGVVISKSPTKTSQKGTSYAIWKISDLMESMNTVCLFLFSGAYKNFWKTTVGSVIGVLNPNVMESKDDTDLATLSVDNPQKIMILGRSKDMGTCRSVKKNGQPCSSIVNLNRCEYCVYHVKQEYRKCSKRAELQSSNTSSGFSLDLLKGKPKQSKSLYSNMPMFTPVIAERNRKQEERDAQRLALLSGPTKRLERTSDSADEPKKKSVGVELSRQQTKKDLERLKKLRGWQSTVDFVPSTPSPVRPALVAMAMEEPTKNKIPSLSSLSASPRLGAGCVGGTIDFSQPVTKKHIDRAKVNAIKWVQQNGKIKPTNPNKVRSDKEEKQDRGLKRTRDAEKSEGPETKRPSVLSDQFKKLMEAKSAHTDLIEKSYQEEQEKYFNKLETKERMEEKMMTTYKVPCKAVVCLICKYTAFSASDTCKEQRHPLRVSDATKRFFKCSDCGNRTVSLDRIPKHSCTKCGGSGWERAAMMEEKRIQVAQLSVRGGEEKFIGSTVSDANLNLLVPESD